MTRSFVRLCLARQKFRQLKVAMYLIVQLIFVFLQNGFDYLLTYYDDPQSSFPSPVYAWMAASGVHDYVDKLHKATQQFNDGSALRPTLSITKGTISSSASAISNNTSVHFQTTHQQAQTHYAWHRSAL